MADEITVPGGTFKFLKSGESDEFSTVDATVDMTGTEYIKKTQEIGTAAEALVLGDVTTPGLMKVQNLGDYTVSLHDGAAGAPLVTMLIGDPAMTFRWPSGSTPYGTATGAASRIKYLLLDT